MALGRMSRMVGADVIGMAVNATLHLWFAWSYREQTSTAQASERRRARHDRARIDERVLRLRGEHEADHG